MPRTIQGIGTEYIGQRDFRADGSYITTEWFAIVIPVIPLRSLRVIRIGNESGGWFPFVSSKDTYKVLETFRPNRRQIVCVYGFMLSYALWIALSTVLLLFHGSEAIGEKLSIYLWMFTAVLPFLIPWFLRLRARRF
jgi:hypothetical protein